MSVRDTLPLAHMRERRRDLNDRADRRCFLDGVQKVERALFGAYSALKG